MTAAGEPAPAGTSVVSVIIPAYNASAHLAETLDAVLAQTRLPEEILVVDDGSDDDTPGVAAAYAPVVTTLRGDHAGAAAARQRGLDTVRGDLVATCDADDVWLPHKLENQLAVLEGRPDLHAVGCLVDEFLSPDTDPSALPRRGLLNAHPATNPSTIVVRRAFLDRVGGFRGGDHAVEFVDWYARALEAGLRAEVVDEVLCRRRIHSANLSRGSGAGDYLRAVREHLARRRGRGS